MKRGKYLCYAFGQGLYGSIFCFIGVVFSHVHQLDGTLVQALTLYGALYPLVFLCTAVTNGVLRRALADIETAHTLPDWLWMVSPVGCLCIWAWASLTFGSWRWQVFWICAMWGAVDGGVTRMCRRKENYTSQQNPELGPGNMRFSLLLPAFTGVIQNFLLGALVPLAIQLRGGWPVTCMGLLGLYILTWYLTRKTSRSFFAAFHTGIYIAILSCGLVFLVVIYILEIEVPLEFLLSFKAFFMAFLSGVYLSIPEAYQRTWEQRCTRENFCDRTKTLGLVLCTFDPIIFTLAIWVRFSWIFMLVYAIGGAILFQFVRKRRKHASIWRMLFSACAAGCLLFEYSGLLPARCYSLQYIAPDINNILLSGLQLLFLVFEFAMSRSSAGESNLSEEVQEAEGNLSDSGIVQLLSRPIRLKYLRIAILAILCGATTPMEMIIGFSQQHAVSCLAITVSLLVTASIDIIWLAFRKKNERMVW